METNMLCPRHGFKMYAVCVLAAKHRKNICDPELAGVRRSPRPDAANSQKKSASGCSRQRQSPES